jgi:N-acyl-L-homoserine lactone synthetase
MPKTGYWDAGDAEALGAMFVARKEIFVDLLGWDVPVLAGQFELDRFDDPHARYVILCEAGQRHRASARLLPTTRPHILDSLFRGLCDEEVPTGPSTFEITRFCVDRHLPAKERLRARNQLVSSLAMAAIVTGIARYTAVAEIGWMRQILRFGWRCRLLGEPRTMAGRTLGALCIEIEGDTMDRLTGTGIYDPNQSHDFRQLGTMRAAA